VLRLPGVERSFAIVRGYRLATGLLRDDDAAAQHVGQLVKRQRGDEALFFLDEYSASRRSPQITVLQAPASIELGDENRLAREDPDESDPESAAGATIAGFIQVAHAMLALGVI
jgi:hypothetical protein